MLRMLLIFLLSFLSLSAMDVQYNRRQWYDPMTAKMQPLAWVTVYLSPQESETVQAVTVEIIYEKDGKPNVASRSAEQYRPDGVFDFLFYNIGQGTRVLKVVVTPKGKPVVVDGDL